MTCTRRRWTCRQLGLLSLGIFIGVGFYGVFEFLFGSPPPPKVTFYIGNVTAMYPPQAPNLSLPTAGYAGTGERVGTDVMQVGDIKPNCGLEKVCPDHHFPVHVYSGKNKDDRPRVCISGKYVIEKDVNKGGRGLNLVVVDPKQMKAILAKHFDTYAGDSSQLETFLSQEVLEGDILVVVTFDEASRNLSPTAKNMFAKLGSGQIQNLQFRGQWFMVTRKGINGFSPFEDLKASKGGLWTPIDEKFCVSRQLQGQSIMPDPPVDQNPERLKFCTAHPHVTDFCSVSHREMPLRPAILTNHQIMGSAMFTTPIMVIAGTRGHTSLSDLTLTLQTVLGQPGVQNKYVVVVYDPRHIPDVFALSRLFNFSSKAIVPQNFNDTMQYYEVMQVVFETAHAAFPESPYITIVEAGLLLAPDFLAYTASLLPLLHDPNILGISAWNPNGYLNVSTRPDLAYRVEDFPGMAFTLRMDTYLKELRTKMKECCNRRGWEGWFQAGRRDREIVIPDISRVLHRPVGPELEPSTPLIHALFQRLRATNLEMNAPILNGESLAGQRYETHLSTILNASTTLTPSRHDVLRCANEGDIQHLHLNLTTDRQVVLVLPYKEGDTDGWAGMKLLCHCFGLFHHHDSPPKGLHKGLLRFSMKGSEVILLSNHSPHFHTTKFVTTALTLP
ncbi:protein O-linked-mannose beta-1,2-N-acetylglucosaminyltransferase 1-like isoform X2 [Portunus trituberculatus]|uniref:protein O-linked-mannose beta-1,2-N-acetylglucosaminyltransferase 1-like isoform X2 n=1 Tax=Portunus trituberculatus TaxID=210409 RepID=UPI001E1D116F|nr:protein O-linked-mannose beta-1,2-N-acetylglucosaminyltransferase 1-like isoform X2 [Portunus trituberculatus]